MDAWHLTKDLNDLSAYFMQMNSSKVIEGVKKSIRTQHKTQLCDTLPKYVIGLTVTFVGLPSLPLPRLG